MRLVPAFAPQPRMRHSRRAGAAAFVFLLALALGCGERPVTAFRVKEVVPPQGGDVLTVTVASNGKVLALGESHLFGWDEDKQEWRGRIASELAETTDGESAFHTVLVDGQNHSYPRDHLLTSWGGAVWLLTRDGDAPALFYTDTAGRNWKRILLPWEIGDSADDQTEELAGRDADAGSPSEEQLVSPEEPLPAESREDPASSDDDPPETTGLPPTHPLVQGIRAAEPYRILGSDQGFFLVGTTQIWKFTGTKKDALWEPLGMEGIPRTADGLPPAVRNYLPNTSTRPFEMMTVLSDQLLVFRRNATDEPWVMVSTLTSVDRQLLGVPNADTVFLVGPGTIRRSDDQGERWFRFWPEGQPKIESALVVTKESADPGYLLLAGTVDGSIWLTRDGGAEWKQTRDADPDLRSVTGLAASEDALWVSTLGRGVLRSLDDGETWEPVNEGLRATRPLDVAFSATGELLIASRSGLHRLAGPPDSGNFVTVHDRATTALHVEPRSERAVAGTTSGDIVTFSESSGAVNIPSPFGTRTAFEFVGPRLEGDPLPPQAVVAIASRDDGQRWLAWSRKNGAASSEDGGQSWTKLDLSDALLGAMSTSSVTQFIVDPGETIYLVEESPDSRTPALLWRSSDNGESWTTVHAFERTQSGSVMVRPRPPNYPGVLFSAHGSTFQRSTDYGETWNIVTGPWATHRIVGVAVDETQAALLVDTRRHLEIVTVEALDATMPLARRHIVVFPRDDTPESGSLTQFEISERRVVLTSRDRVWIGSLPARRGGIPNGTAMLATLASALVLIGVAFLLMRSAMLRP